MPYTWLLPSNIHLDLPYLAAILSLVVALFYCINSDCINSIWSKGSRNKTQEWEGNLVPTFRAALILKKKQQQQKVTVCTKLSLSLSPWLTPVLFSVWRTFIPYLLGHVHIMWHFQFFLFSHSQMGKHHIPFKEVRFFSIALLFC